MSDKGDCTKTPATLGLVNIATIITDLKKGCILQRGKGCTGKVCLPAGIVLKAIENRLHTKIGLFNG